MKLKYISLFVVWLFALFVSDRFHQPSSLPPLDIFSCAPNRDVLFVTLHLPCDINVVERL